MAPDFSLEGTAGSFRLSEHRGERVILIFYPGDDTPVCTKQFCSYRDAAEEMAELGARVVGISTRDVASKEAFATKHGLTTELLADPDAAVAEAYGVYAKRLRMAKRTVIVVDEEGRIAHRRGNPLSLTFDTPEELAAVLAALPDPSGV
jgi:peroxiredoxin Q/BCP